MRMDMSKRTIGLYQYSHPVLIYPCSSGIIFEVQCGGMVCRTQSVEGVMLPIQFHDVAERFQRLTAGLEELEPGCFGKTITPQEADALDALFIECWVPLVVNRDRLQESTEAWLPVRIRRKEERWLPAKDEDEITAFIEAARIIKPDRDEQEIRATLDACRAGDMHVLGDFAGEEAILIWANCD